MKKKTIGDSSDSGVDCIEERDEDHPNEKNSKDFPLVGTVQSEPSNEVPVTKPGGSGAGNMLLKFVGNLKSTVKKLNDTDLKNAKKVIA